MTLHVNVSKIYKCVCVCSDMLHEIYNKHIISERVESSQVVPNLVKWLISVGMRPCKLPPAAIHELNGVEFLFELS